MASREFRESCRRLRGREVVVRGHMQLRILGPLELVVDHHLVKTGGPREHIVLAALALRANRVVTVEYLIDAVWGEDPPATARSQVQTCISALRKVLDSASLLDAIATSAAGYS